MQHQQSYASKITMLKQRYRNKKDLFTYMTTRCKCLFLRSFRPCFIKSHGTIGSKLDVDFFHTLYLFSELLFDAAEALPAQVPVTDPHGLEEVPTSAGCAKPVDSIVAVAFSQGGLS